METIGRNGGDEVGIGDATLCAPAGMAQPATVRRMSKTRIEGNLLVGGIGRERRGVWREGATGDDMSDLAATSDPMLWLSRMVYSLYADRLLFFTTGLGLPCGKAHCCLT
jgi:hypothetical protein